MFLSSRATDGVDRLYEIALDKASLIDGSRAEQETVAITDSGVFDAAHYGAARGVEFPDIASAIHDYVTAGAAAGASPNPYFDPIWYAAQHSYLAPFGINLFVHYLLVGAFQNYDPSPLFDSSWYLETNPDVAAARINPLVHYLSIGQLERRDPIPGFDSVWYLNEYPDVAATGEDPFLHYIRHGGREGRFPNPLFDSQWYLSHYPDIAAAGVNPLMHYLLDGATEGRRPNPVFDGRSYLTRHPRSFGINPIVHYLRFRTLPERISAPEVFPDFDGAWYLTANVDVATSGSDPLLHYVRYGRFEGRPALPTPPRDRIVLDSDYAMSPEDFALFRESCLGNASQEPERFASLLLRILVTVPTVEARDRLPATFAAIAALTLPSGVMVEVVVHDLLAPPCQPWNGALAQDMPPHIVTRAATDRFLLLSALRQVVVRDVVLFLSAGDQPAPDLPAHLAARLAPDTDLALFDLHFVDQGRVFPILLPGVNPFHALNVDYFRSRFLADGNAVRAVLCADNGFEPRRVALQVLAQARAAQQPNAAIHIALPLVEIIESRDAIAEERRSMVLADEPWNFVFGPARDEAVSRYTVSIIICTKDNERLITQLARSILTLGPQHRLAEIVVVLNEPDTPYADRVFREMPPNDKLVIAYLGGPFNFSAKSNYGASFATGDILLFLNDDIVPVSETWLEELVAPFVDPQVGLTAPLLVYPNAKVQHAGMYAQPGGVTGHALRFARLPEEDYMFLGSVPRNVSVATGAAMAIRRTLFDALEGFDEQLANYIQDVDLSLRVLHSGHDLVMNPRSVLIHMETTTIKENLHDDPIMQARCREFDYFMARWRETLARGDAYHNPHFVPTDERMRSLTLRNPE